MGIASVQARVAEKKKTRGLDVLLGVSREPRPIPNCGWLAGFFFYVKPSGVGRGDFVTLIRVSSQKAVQSQGILPARLIFIMLLAEAPCIKSSQIYRGCYTVARRYEFYFRVANQYFTNERSE